MVASGVKTTLLLASTRYLPLARNDRPVELQPLRLTRIDARAGTFLGGNDVGSRPILGVDQVSCGALAEGADRVAGRKLLAGKARLSFRLPTIAQASSWAGAGPPDASSAKRAAAAMMMRFMLISLACFLPCPTCGRQVVGSGQGRGEEP